MVPFGNHRPGEEGACQPRLSNWGPAPDPQKRSVPRAPFRPPTSPFGRQGQRTQDQAGVHLDQTQHPFRFSGLFYLHQPLLMHGAGPRPCCFPINRAMRLLPSETALTDPTSRAASVPEGWVTPFARANPSCDAAGRDPATESRPLSVSSGLPATSPMRAQRAPPSEVRHPGVTTPFRN
jgi:hypothetical protein